MGSKENEVDANEKETASQPFFEKKNITKTKDKPSRKKDSSKSVISPPWKKKNKGKPSTMSSDNIFPVGNDECDDNIFPGIGSSESRPVKSPMADASGGFQSQTQTFTGERGGAAEDAELLAELRAISSKSSSADRFGSSEDDELDTNEKETASQPSLEKKNITKTKDKPSRKKDSSKSVISPPW